MKYIYTVLIIALLFSCKKEEENAYKSPLHFEIGADSDYNLEDINVKLTTGDEVIQSEMVDSNGTILFDNVQAGRYVLEMQAEGFSCEKTYHVTHLGIDTTFYRDYYGFNKLVDDEVNITAIENKGTYLSIRCTASVKGEIDAKVYHNPTRNVYTSVLFFSSSPDVSKDNYTEFHVSEVYYIEGEEDELKMYWSWYRFPDNTPFYCKLYLANTYNGSYLDETYNPVYSEIQNEGSKVYKITKLSEESYEIVEHN